MPNLSLWLLKFQHKNNILVVRFTKNSIFLSKPTQNASLYQSIYQSKSKPNQLCSNPLDGSKNRLLPLQFLMSCICMRGENWRLTNIKSLLTHFRKWSYIDYINWKIYLMKMSFYLDVNSKSVQINSISFNQQKFNPLFVFVVFFFCPWIATNCGAFQRLCGRLDPVTWRC